MPPLLHQFTGSRTLIGASSVPRGAFALGLARWGDAVARGDGDLRRRLPPRRLRLTPDRIGSGEMGRAQSVQHLMRGAALGLCGGVSGLATVTKGLVLGPVLVGLAIDRAQLFFEPTGGYQAMWPAVGIPVLGSLVFVWRLRASA